MAFKFKHKKESFEQIRVRMFSKWLMSSDANSCITIAFTSRLPGEGVTTIVSGLSRTFANASAENILVVDVAKGNNRVAELLGLQNKLAIPDQLEADDLDPLDAISRGEEGGIDLLTLSDASHFGPIGSQRAKSIIERLRAHYRVILIDAGPLTNDSGACWLAASDYRVLVIDAGKATYEVLENQRKELANSGIKIDGSILNKREFPIPDFLY